MLPLTPTEKRHALSQMDDLPRALVMRHLQQLDSDYYQEFDLAAIRDHLNIMATLGSQRPFHLQTDILGERFCGLTLIGLDYRGLLASLAGLLSGLGYSIRSARAFTCTRQFGDNTNQDHIVDFLILEHPNQVGTDWEAQNKLREGIDSLYRRLAAGDMEGLRADLIAALMESLPKQSLDRPENPAFEVSFETLAKCTRMTVKGRDRQAMLFCLSLAMNLQNISILKLMTSEEGGDVGDHFVIVGPQNGSLRNPEETEPLRVAILLMERFLWALSAASDITSALQGLNRLISAWLPDSMVLAEGQHSDATFFPALARILSAGPHIWNEVLAMGPEAFQNLLESRLSEERSPRRETYHALWMAQLVGLQGETPFAALIRWRSREILKIEIDFLLDPEMRVEPMSQALTALAESALAAALRLLEKEMADEFGEACDYAVFALGKFGSGEMGSGSDLEILMLYADKGHTESTRTSLRYGEFFSQLAHRLQRQWEAPQVTTFTLDWKLRPHGESGPMATQGEVWRDYLRVGGGALDYELQALLRLRPIWGSETFCKQILAWRDEAVFRDPPVSIEHTLQLRDQQIQTKTKPNRFNAKFSPGGMVDIEYAVQFLQLQYGRNYPQLRRFSTAMALEGLLEAGIISLAEFEHLYNAFLFLRRLQGHLRLVRGLAKDLEAPALGSLEFRHLALRMGYTSRPEFKPESQLEADISRIRSVVLGFMNHRFRNAQKSPLFFSSLSQNLMDDSCSVTEAEPALRRMGMRDLPQAQGLFLELFQTVVEKRLLAAALLMAEERFLKSPDPDYVLRQLVRYLHGMEYPDVAVRQMLHHPALLQALLLLFGHSVHLGDILIRENTWLKDLLRPGKLNESLDQETLAREASLMVAADGSGQSLSENLCRFRDQGYIRIALRDVFLHAPLQSITRDITWLSDAIIRVATRVAFEPWMALDTGSHWAVFAMGKLGGQELNYSSDIDLIIMREDDAGDGELSQCFEACARALIALLGSATGAGRLFRVDMNLRPWGRQGYLTGTLSQYRRYYRQEAQGWELQAWLKARTIAGAGDLGNPFIAEIQALATSEEKQKEIAASMLKVRHMGLEQLQKQKRLAGEVKLGPGGIRTVEFYTQALQIRHGREIPELITGNTLEALGRLQRFQIISPSHYQILTSAYVFLRRIEHRLQLLNLQQQHEMPSDSDEMEKLARRMGYEARFGQGARVPFLEHYRKHMLTLLAISEQLFVH